MKRFKLISERKKRGVTQSKLAKELGITQKFLSELERGDKDPSFKTACKLEDYFKISVCKLMKKG